MFVGRRFHGNAYVHAANQENKMVDFKKLREQSQARARAEMGNASSTVKFIPVAKTQLELLKELVSDCDLNEWEEGFCKSNISWMTGKADAHLSAKQNAVLQKMVIKYELDPDKNSEQAYRQNVNAIADAAIKDLDEDDIPF